jgi:hypothetical protein
MRFGGELEVGKDTDMLRLLDERSKHRLSNSELLSVAECARNSQNYWSQLGKNRLELVFNYIAQTVL